MSNLCNDLIGLFWDFGPTQGTLQCRMLKWYLQCSSDFQNYFVGHVSLFWHAEYPHASAPAIHLKIIDLLFGPSIFLLKWGNLCLKSFSHWLYLSLGPRPPMLCASYQDQYQENISFWGTWQGLEGEDCWCSRGNIKWGKCWGNSVASETSLSYVVMVK